MFFSCIKRGYTYYYFCFSSHIAYKDLESPARAILSSVSRIKKKIPEKINVADLRIGPDVMWIAVTNENKSQIMRPGVLMR